MSEQDRAPAAQQAAAQLARLSDEFFEIVHATDPLSATQLGVSGFDALVPDPSRDGAARGAFHGTVLGSGAVPLGVLGQVVTRWTDEPDDASGHPRPTSRASSSAPITPAWSPRLGATT